MKKDKRIVLYVIAAVVLIAALYLMNSPITASIIADNTASTVDFSREKYPEYYSLLLPKPSDFNEIRLMFRTGIISDVPERINKSYWVQPEWWPLYEESFLTTLKMIIEQHRTPIWSIGIYPEQSYKKINQEWLQNPTITQSPGQGLVEIRNDTVVTKSRFWLRAAPGAIKYYGVRLAVDYPAKVNAVSEPKYGLEKQTVEQDPEVTKKYIRAWTDEPTIFNLGTYFPYLNPDYVREVWLSVEVSKDTPKGKYIASVDVTTPSKDYQEEQSLKYGLIYTDPNIGMSAGPTSYKILIEVA